VVVAHRELEEGMGYSKALRAAVTVVALLVGANAGWAQQQPTGTWANEQSGQTFYYGAMTSDGTYFYCMGGYQYGVSVSYPGYYQQCVRYDPVNNTWATMAQMAFPAYYNAGGYYNGRVFSLAGYNPNSGYSNQIQAYTVANNTWATLSATLSIPVYLHAAATMTDRIYVFGGYYNGYSNVCNEFNPTNDTTTTRATMPLGMYYLSAAGIPALGKAYALTGYTQNGMTANCYEYSIPDASNPNGVWATKTPITINSAQQPRYYAAAAALNNRLYLFGGYSNNGYTNTTFEYSPTTDTWAQRANMTYQRYLHGATAINGKGYVYGGGSSPNYNEEFTPPSFGSPPNAPTNVTQVGSRAETSLQAQADPNQYDGWTNNQISFSANVTDPDANQQVRLRARVKNVNTATWTNLDSGLQSQGIITLNWTIPADGAYDWQYRVEDAFANSYPLAINSWADAFGNATSPDFRSDQVPPADPLAISPSNVDLDVHHPVGGYGTLVWTESTDNGPVAGISYEIQVARDGGFIDIEAQIFSTAGTSSYPVYLTVSRYNKYWRLRARDVGGNFSAWSTPLTFRVVYDDQLDHAAGDAKRSCGMAATGTASLVMALLGFAILGLASGRRFFRT
jgi:hypothetical protein